MITLAAFYKMCFLTEICLCKYTKAQAGNFKSIGCNIRLIYSFIIGNLELNALSNTLTIR